MIVLTDKMNSEINGMVQSYDDLENKPMINGVVLEGNKSSEELGIEVDTSDFYTKSQSDDRFQPKGDYLTSVPAEYVTETELTNTLNQKDYATTTYVDNAIANIEDVSVDLTGYATEQWVENKGYLTSIPSEYVTETELNEALAGLDGSDVPYVVVKDNGDNTYSIVSGDLQSVFDAYNNNNPYLIYLPNGLGAGYYSLAETVQISGTQLQALSFAHTGTTHTWRYWRFYNNSNIVTLYSEISIRYATTTELNSKQDTLVSGTNIKTINGNSILGSGNLTIESGGSVDLSNYYTKTEIDNKIGDINTILENIIG